MELERRTWHRFMPSPRSPDGASRANAGTLHGKPTEVARLAFPLVTSASSKLPCALVSRTSSCRFRLCGAGRLELKSERSSIDDSPIRTPLQMIQHGGKKGRYMTSP